MQTIIDGTISSVFPNDINTDDIIPAWTLQESIDRSFFKQYAFANYDRDFVKRSAKYEANIVVAGKNFGCGSSREQAVYALQENGVVLVIAPSYPDIFYRNCLNNGLVALVVDDISPFKMGQKVQIDLENKIIEVAKKSLKMNISDQDAKTFMFGGKIVRIREHVEHMITDKKNHSIPGNFAKSITKSPRPQTMGEKIISDHMGRPVFSGDKIDKLAIDVLFFNEVIGPPAIKDFKKYVDDIYKKHRKKSKVFDPKRVFFIPDHTVPSSSVMVCEGIDLMEQFSREQGAFCYKEGDEIEHVILIEDGRTTIANMAVEMGARTMIFEPDSILEKYVKNRARFPWKFYYPDKQASYEKTIDVNLSELEPCVAFPHKPGNVTFTTKMNQYMKKSQKSTHVDFAPVYSLAITDAFLGACTNGRYEELHRSGKSVERKKNSSQSQFCCNPCIAQSLQPIDERGRFHYFCRSRCKYRVVKLWPLLWQTYGSCRPRGSDDLFIQQKLYGEDGVKRCQNIFGFSSDCCRIGY